MKHRPVNYRCTRCGYIYTDPGRTRLIEISHACHPSGRTVRMIPVSTDTTETQGKPQAESTNQ